MLVPYKYLILVKEMGRIFTQALTRGERGSNGFGENSHRGRYPVKTKANITVYKLLLKFKTKFKTDFYFKIF